MRKIMNKTLTTLLLLSFSIFGNNSFFIDGSCKGAGIGYEFNYKSCFLFLGSSISPKYNNGQLYTYDHFGTALDSTTYYRISINTVPKGGIGLNVPIRNRLNLFTYIGYLTNINFEYENYKNTKSYFSPGFNLEIWDGSFVFGIGLKNYNFKIPIGISIDTEITPNWNGFIGISIYPRLIIYL
jgi:hypothetical protein